MPRSKVGNPSINEVNKNNRFNTENAKENGRKGGVNSGKARREKKARLESAQTLVQQMMMSAVPDPKARRLLAERFGIEEKEVCGIYSMMFGIMNNMTKKGTITDLEKLFKMGGMMTDDAYTAIEATNSNILSLANLINNPVDDRTIEE